MRTIIFHKVLPVCLFLLSMLPAMAWGGEIIVLQSAAIEAYNEAFRGVATALRQDIPTRGHKSVLAHTIQSYILSEAESPGQLRKDIIRQHPDLIVVIGSSSLSLVKGINDVPIVYLMVPFPELLIRIQDNITGIKMNIGPDQELEQLTRMAPRVKNVGLLYDPDRTGRFVEKAREYAARNSLNLIALPVSESSEVAGGLDKLKGRIDWFWMVPDLTVLTPQTVDIIMLFSLENRVPVLTFSEKYLAMGAILSVSIDPYDIGRQGAEMALKIMKDQDISGLPPARVRTVVVRTNPEAAQMLGVALQPEDSNE